MEKTVSIDNLKYRIKFECLDEGRTTLYKVNAEMRDGEIGENDKVIGTLNGTLFIYPMISEMEGHSRLASDLAMAAYQLNGLHPSPLS